MTHLVVTALMFLPFFSTTESNKKPQTLYFPNKHFGQKTLVRGQIISSNLHTNISDVCQDKNRKTRRKDSLKKVYCHISNPNIKVPVNCRTNSVKQTEHRANRSQQTHRQIHWFRTLERLLHQWSGSTTLTHVTDPTNVDSAEVQTVSRTARCGRYFCRII